MPSEKPKFKRRKIVVDARLQVGLALHLIVRLYIYFAVFTLLVNSPAIWTVATASADEPAYAAAAEQMRWFASEAVLPLSLTFVAIAVHGVIFTHRVAGPVFRFKQVLGDMGRLRFDQVVRIRRKDYLGDMCDAFNTTLERLRGEVARVHRMNSEAHEAVQRLLAQAEDEERTREEVLAAAHAVLDCVERMDRHLARSDGTDDGEERALRVPPPEAVMAPEPDDPVEATVA